MIERLLASWRGLATRERRMVAAGGTLLLLVVGYLVFFEPAFDGRRRLAGELPALRDQLARMQGMAAEARRLSGESRAPESPQALRAAIEQSVRAAGLGAGLSELKLEGELFELRFSGVLYPAWLEWLDATLRSTRLRVVDSSVTRESAPATVSVRMVLEAPRREAR